MTFLKLIRYQNLLMVLLIMILVKYVLIETALPKPYLSHLEFTIFALSVLFITAGGYIVNDIYDVDLDRINKPSKTYIESSISKKNAWRWYIVFSVLGLALATYLSIKVYLPDHILYYLLGIACLFFYSSYFQKKPLVGNLIIAFICGALIYLLRSFDLRGDRATLLKDLAFIDNIRRLQFSSMTIWFYIKFSFFGTLIRELLKDIEDTDGDYNAGYKTIPILFGRKRARNLIIVLSILFNLYLILYAYVYYGLGFKTLSIFFGILVLVFIYFLYKLWFAKAKKQFHYLSNLMKLILFFGILSMILYTFD